MKEFTLSISKINEMVADLLRLAKPHPQTTTDGRTITRDFEIHPKAKVLLGRDLKTLKEIIDQTEELRQDLNAQFIPNGQGNHTPEENAAFQKEWVAVLRSQKKVSLHQVWLYHEKTDKPDAIDLTKAPIPFDLMQNILDVILIEPDAGNSESKPA